MADPAQPSQPVAQQQVMSPSAQGLMATMMAASPPDLYGSLAASATSVAGMNGLAAVSEQGVGHNMQAVSGELPEQAASENAALTSPSMAGEPGTTANVAGFVGRVEAESRQGGLLARSSNSSAMTPQQQPHASSVGNTAVLHVQGVHEVTSGQFAAGLSQSQAPTQWFDGSPDLRSS